MIAPRTASPPSKPLGHLFVTETEQEENCLAIGQRTLGVGEAPGVSWVVRLVVLLIAILAGFGVVTAHAQTVDKLQGLCTRGGQVITTAGAGSSQKAEMVVPSCTVTIYIAGTLTPATIYSDRLSTPTLKANPFTANTAGEWWFYAASGRYDIRLSGGTGAGAYPSPVTYGDFWIVNPGSGTPVTQAYTTITKDQVAITQRSILEIPGSTGHNATDSTPLVSSVLSSPRIPVGAYNIVEAFNASGIPNDGTASVSATSSTVTMNTFPSGFAMKYYWKVGQGVLIAGAGVAGADLKTTVTAVGSTTITIATPASTTVSAVRIQHDDTVALQAAVNNAANGNTQIWFPEGGYIITAPITIPAIAEGRSLILAGTGKSGSTIHYQGLGSLFVQLDPATVIDSLEVKDLALATSTPGDYSSVRPLVNQGSAFDFSYSQVVNYPKFTNLRIIGWGRWGIFCANCQGGWVANSIFRSNAQGHLGLVGPETILQAGAAEANVNSIRDSQFDLAPNISNTDTAVTGLGMAIGSYVLTSSTPMFSSTHEGRLIRVAGAGSGGGDIIALIKTHTSTTSVTLSANNQTGSTLSALTGTVYKSNFGSIYLHRANVTKLSSLTIQGNFSGSTRNEFAIRAENSYGLEVSNLWVEDTGGGSGHDIELLNAPAATIKGYKSNADSTAATGDTHGGNLYLRNGSTVTVDGMFAENPTKHFDLDTTSSLIIDASTLSTSDNAFNTFDQSRDRITLGPTVRYKTEAATSPSQRNTLAMYDDPLVNTVVNGRFEDGVGGMTGWTDSNPTFHTLVAGTTRFTRYQKIDTSALADNATQATAFSQTVSIPDNYPSRLWTLGFDLYVESFGTTPTTNRYVTITVTASGAGIGYDDFKVQSTNTSNLALARWERIQYSLFLPTGTGRTFQIIVNTSRGPTSPIVRLANFRLSPGRAVNGSNDQPLTELQGGVVRNFFDFVGQAAPAVSALGRGRIYVDTSGTFQCSENGAAYAPCGSGSGSAVTDYLGAINVKKAPYSCTGDGLADDTACVTTALAAAVASTGRPLYFPNGTYLIDPGTLTLATNGVIITGDAPGKTVLKSRTNAAALITIDASVVNPHSITIKDLTLEGFGSGAANHGIRISGANTPFNIRFENLRLTNFTGLGIYDTSGIFQSRIENVVISMNSGGGNAFDLIGSNDLVLINNYVTTVANSTAAYRIHSGRPTLIGNNGVNPGSTNGSWGVFGNITAEDGSDSYVFGNFIGNNIEDFTQYGLRFKEGSFGYFHGNTFLAPSTAIVVTPLKFDFVDNGQRGIWDATNSINTAGATYTNSNPINSRGAPFTQIGGNAFTTYYDTNIASSMSFPYMSPQLVAGSTNIAMLTTRAQITALESSGLVGDLTGASSFAGDAARVLLQDGTAARPTRTYGSDTDTGEYRAGANILGFAAGGVEAATLSNTTFTLGRASGATGQFTLYNSTNANTTTIQPGVAAASRTYTWPTNFGAAGTVLTDAAGNGTLSWAAAGGTTLPAVDTTSIVEGSSDATKEIRFEVDGLTTGTVRVLTPPDANIVIAGSAAALTSGRVPFVTTGGLLLDGSEFTYTTASKTLTITSASAAFVDIAGVDTSSAVRVSSGDHPGNGGGVIFPFVGGGQSTGPGVWWSDNTYANTSGLWLSLGLNWQGNGGSGASFKIRETTGTSSDGTVRYTFNPDGSIITQTLSTGNTGSAHITQDNTIISTGTTTAGFGLRTNVNLENGSGSTVLSTGVEQTLSIVTAAAETGKWEVFARNAGAAAARSFTVEGLQNYATVQNKGNQTGAFTIDFSLGNYVTATATGNWTTVTFSNIKAGAKYVISVTQGGGGGFTWTPPTLFKYPGGVAGNILTGTAGAVDVFICETFDTTNLWCNGLFDVKNP